MHGGTDLGDLYRDRLSLRQVWVRIKALPPGTAFGPTNALDAALTKAQADEERAATEQALDALDRYRRG